MIELDIASVRLFLHLFGITVWIGGQLIMASLVPVLRAISPDAPRRAAVAFGRIAWPFYGLAVVTGIWLMFSLDLESLSSGYSAALGIKLLLVAASGVAAGVHTGAETPKVRAITGGLALASAIGALYIGVLLVT